MTDPRPSDAVRQRIELGWSPACDGLAALSWYPFHFDERAPGPYRELMVYAGDRRVEIIVSPMGRSVRVFVDGIEVP